ncbi:MSMEG_1061 family FMN-dependent PPOX-type flavoprotein [Actinokineospora spheciospongiae]|uniref:MSMEG_1061 family FMN-dependent PPOX-type flavoprotein n=1 Tax=Actinokineospora spheciospongiae TaxID=909613 RepID=UPI000D70EC0E|nr:MSMEG_1061 family FMN-dependent PPOX-type flavoprotein [Actinokineospora spheciospongiae]PWW65912.1 hypothetical protein DFQ13_102671 [Actinokineospora spheciospongiae]
MTDDLFTDAITDIDELRELYPEPAGQGRAKEIDTVDDMARRLIALAPLVFVASADADGRCDVSPRGGPPGFVSVLGDGTVVVPDATGNRRIDTFRNVVVTGRVGLVFVIPGRGQTLRVNGAACVSRRPELLASLTAVGKAPRAALVVRPDEVFTHCPKAFVRSALWDPASWPDATAQPTPAEVVHTHLRDPGISLADVERDMVDSLRDRLA